MTVWKCPDCPVTVHRNLDDALSESWFRGLAVGHQQVHDTQLAAHGGDRDLMRQHIKHPSLCHVQCGQVQPPGVAPQG